MEHNKLPPVHDFGDPAPENSSTLKTPIPFPLLYPNINIDYEPINDAPHEIIIGRPLAHSVNIFREKFPELFMGKTHGGVVNRYGLNFLNVEDQLRNWHALSTTTQLGLSEIIGSNWERRNSSQWGIKKRVEENIGLPQAEHLLLLNMVELGNMVKGGERVVFSNLINHQGFNHPNITRLNFIDPREAKTGSVKMFL